MNGWYNWWKAEVSYGRNGTNETQICFLCYALLCSMISAIDLI